MISGCHLENTVKSVDLKQRLKKIAKLSRANRQRVQTFDAYTKMFGLRLFIVYLFTGCCPLVMPILVFSVCTVQDKADQLISFKICCKSNRTILKF